MQHNYTPEELALMQQELIPPYVSDTSKKQGDFTADDYYSVPEGKNAELIDGVLYDMSASPSFSHQILRGEIGFEIYNYNIQNDRRYITLYVPVNIQLDSDGKTIVQPDIFILFDKSKQCKMGINGVPDFMLEILSPATRKKDMIIKLHKYMSVGVREYWILDPDARQLIVYDFEHSRFPIIYNANDTVPISVLDNQCEINLKKIFEQLDD